MTALTDSFPRLTKGRDGLKTGLLIRGGTALTIYKGSLIAHRIGSELREVPDPNNPRTDLIYDGVATNEMTISTLTDGTEGYAVDSDGNPLTINTEAGLCCAFDTGTGPNAITAQMIGEPAYGYDNNTLYATSNNGTLSYVGLIYLFDEDNTVIVDIQAENPLGAYLFGPGAAGDSATSDDTVACVATSFPAGTFANGVLTLTATGAFSTAQDTNITLAVGDKFILPAGTITTLVVSAANSGVYEVTSLGGTGVAATFTRSTRWAHGSVIAPGTKIKVAGQNATSTANAAIWTGTLWRSDPATAGLLVGTGDPALFPERVNVAGTCAAGTFTISTVPLRAAGKFSVLIDYTGGTPAATTTSLQASTQTPGAIGTASIVVQEQSHLGTLVNTGTATATVTVIQ